MVSCIKRIATLALLAVLASCVTDGSAPLLRCTSCKIFITSSDYNGNLGGVAGADAKCMSDANYPGKGTYKALIVSNGVRRACGSSDCVTGGASNNTDWVLYPDTEYKRASDGVIIGLTNDDGIFVFPLSAGFGTGLFWTGLASNWTQSIASCTDWTSTAIVPTPIGNSAATDSSVLDNAMTMGICGFANYGLACVEQ